MPTSLETVLLASGNLANSVATTRTALADVSQELDADIPTHAATLGELCGASDELKRLEFSLARYWSHLRQAAALLNDRAIQASPSA